MKILIAALALLGLALPAQAGNSMDAMVVHFDMDGDGALSTDEMTDLVLSMKRVLKLGPESPTEKKLAPPLPEVAETAKELVGKEETVREGYERMVEEARAEIVAWCDTDGDENLSREEKQRVSDALRGEISGKGVGEQDGEMIEKFYLAFNQDGTRGLSTKERNEAKIYIEAQFQMTDAEFAALQEKFIKVVDLDEDWTLSPQEKIRANDLLRGTTQEADLSEDLISAFDYDENGTLSTKERNTAMQLIEEYFKPVPLVLVADQKGNAGKARPRNNKNADAPLESEIDVNYIADNFFAGHDGDLSKNLTYEELVAALTEAKEDGLFRSRLVTLKTLRQERVSQIEGLRGEMMNFFDSDQNGNLTKAEIGKAREALRGRIAGERLGENDEVMVAKVIKAFDTDGSGTISLKERDTAIRALQEHFRPVPIVTEAD